jgi:signal transduction histidine kinase/ligand-binding sensor domain-containing protein
MSRQERFGGTAAAFFLFIFMISGVPLTHRAATPEPSEPMTPVQVDSKLNLQQWGALTTFHGLPSDTVRAIAQDTAGYFWFGTDAGLAVYDGRRIRKLTFSEIENIRIRCLRFGADGALWIGTDAGAFTLQNDKLVPVRGTETQPINAIAFARGGVVRMTSEYGILFTIRGDRTDKLTPETVPLLWIDESRRQPLPLTGLATIGDTTFIGTRGRGVLSLTGNRLALVPNESRPFFVSEILVDEKQAICGVETSARDAGTLAGATPAAMKKIPVITGTAQALAKDGLDRLWVGTNGAGAFCLRGAEIIEHFTFGDTSGGLRSDVVFDIFTDREGVVWFGTNRGVSRHDPNSPRVTPVNENAESNVVRSFLISPDGTQWCGTRRGLFFRRNERLGWQDIAGIGPRAVYALAALGDGRILAGTSSGTFIGDAKELNFRPVPTTRMGPNDSNRAICRFRNQWYVGTFGGGLERLNDNQRLPVAGDTMPTNIVSLYNENDERLWIGTSNEGVFTFDGNRFAREPLTRTLTQAIWCVTGNRRDGLWFGTERGLYKLAGERLLTVVPDGDVRAVQAHVLPDAVWCATTDRGIWTCALTADGRTRLARLDTETGLPSNTGFCLWTGENNLLWIGTSRGLVRYGASLVKPLVRPIRAFGTREYPLDGSPIRLNYPQNSLLIEAIAISSRTFSEKFTYEFQVLDAKDVEIRRGTTRQGQFTAQGLVAGTYRIRVTVIGNDLTASDPVELAFTVGRAPFPFLTVILGTLLAVAVGALAWGFRQNLRLSSTNALLAETRRQVADEAERERRRIARDLHDQTLADLRRLQLRTDTLKRDPDAGTRMAELRREIEDVSVEIRRICEDLSPSVLENVGLSAALRYAVVQTLAQLPEEKRFSDVFDCADDFDETTRLTLVEQLHVYRIAQEALSNAARHAEAKNVILKLTETDLELRLTVEDDGKGFQPSENGGRGVGNIEARAGIIGATAHWETPESGGTRFVLRKKKSGVRSLESGV